MARSFAGVKMVANQIAKHVPTATTTNTNTRRGFAAVSQKVDGSRKSGMAATKVAAEKEHAPWTPDPVTGYYRPENAADEVDVAELRAMLLKQSNNGKN